MLEDNKIWMGVTGDDNQHVDLLLSMANRHGLIAGASGTGKTVTLKTMAEGFSKAGVPVFMADVKGDVSGMAQPADLEKVQKYIDKNGVTNYTPAGCPCRFWGMPGGTGIPVRITVSQMGPTMLSRLLGLSDAQEGVLQIVFRIADDKKWLLDDLKDLRAMLNYVSEHAKEYQTTYGNVSAQSVGSILRELIDIESQGGTDFFGEPSLDLQDWFQCDANGQGYVNILDATKLINSPQIYAMFLLWMLSDLFETLPEAGDLDKPKFVFFFDEAHLLFDDMPKELLDKIIQVVKLIRSKAVGVYFITQSPSDIPDEVLAQLSNRVQHGLRAYTPAEQKAVKAAADAFRENPAFKASDVILNLGTGEALCSFLNEDGQPDIVQDTHILTPQCLMGAADDAHKQAVITAQTELQTKYGTAVDRESAYEDIQAEATAATQAAQAAVAAAGVSDPNMAAAAQVAATQAAAAPATVDATAAAMAAQKKAEEAAAKAAAKQAAAEAKAEAKAEREAEKQAEREAKAKQKAQEQMIKTAGSILGQVGRTAANQLVRGILGGLKR